MNLQNTFNGHFFLRGLFLFMMCLFFPLGAASKDFSFDVELAKKTLKIDQNFEIKVTLKHPNTHRLDLKALESNLKSKHFLSPALFTLERTDTQVAKEENGLVTQELNFTLSPWQVGKIFISFLNIPFYSLADPQEHPIVLSSPIYELEVFPSEYPKDELSPQGLNPLSSDPLVEISDQNRYRLLDNKRIAEEEHEKFFQKLHRRKIAWYQLLVYSGMILVFGVSFYGIVKYRKRQKLEKDLRLADPRHRALKALRALRKGQYPENKNSERFYIELTRILRVFIEEEFKLRAPERSTEEFLHELSVKQPFDVSTQNRLKDFLYQADLVKFACMQAGLEDCKKAYGAAKAFIEKA